MGGGRAPCCDKSKVKKGAWSPAEDLRLIAFIQKHGHANWRALPKQAGLLRCGKSCRLRWINYLRPDVKRGNFTPEEEETIISLHHSMGNKWSKIASHFPGRTDNEIKNVWNTHLKKRVNKRDNDDGSHENETKNRSYDQEKNMEKRVIIDDDQDDQGILAVAEGKEYYKNLTAKTGQCNNMIDEITKEQSGFDSPNSSYASSNTFSSLCPSQVEINSMHGFLDEAFEIPLEPDIEAFWDALDALDVANKSSEFELHAYEVHRHSSNTSGEGLDDDPQAAHREWLKNLEYELGLLEGSRDAYHDDHDNPHRDSNDHQHLDAETAFNKATLQPPDIDIIDHSGN